MSNFQVLLLAGGRGKRMLPLEVCKSLIPFVGKPIIRYIFDDLPKAGLDNVKIVCPQEQIGQIKSFFPKPNQKIKFYVQKQALGMADGVLSVPDLGNKPLIIVSPEDLLEPDAFVKFVRHCQKTNSQIVLAGKFQKEYFPGGYFILKGEKIKGIIEKPPKGKQPSNFVNLVLHYFKNPSKFIDYLKTTASDQDDIYERALDKIIKDGIKTEIFKYTGSWQSLKYPWHILAAMKIILEKRMVKSISKDAQISPKSTIKGNVLIEPGVKILDGACVLGPAYIGENSIIGTNTLVRESMIGDNCTVGFTTEVARSWVGNNCWFHTNYIGDSILQGNVSFGSGAVTANLRIDEKEIFVYQEKEKIATGRTKLGTIIGKDVRIGINASLMPGITIGTNSVVGPGVILTRNLEKNKACFTKYQNLKIKNNNVAINCR